MFVTCYLQGGLGNQLFIIFTTIATAVKNNCEYVIINQTDSPSITPRSTYFSNLLQHLETKDMYKEAIRQIVREKDHMKYEEIPALTVTTMLHGYFQSRKYIDSVRDIILSNVTLTNKKDISALNLSIKLIRDNAKDKKCIFLHVRRGDYVNLAHYHYNIPIEYYFKAIEEHKNKYDCYFVIFSDDIIYCKERFSEFLDKNEVYYSKLNTDYVELMLMSEMDGAIIANSSFSWWGAYLMEIKKESASKESPFIVAPKKWFTTVNENEQNDRNIERHNWKFI